MSQSDPTDHALAAIASILDHSESHRGEPEKAEILEKPVTARPKEVEGYQRLGPGPLAAIRLKWTVRRDTNGDYYVDETIGENSAPVVEGPMSAEAAISFVDSREREARRRFELLKNEMTGPGVTKSSAGNDSGEM